MVFKLYTYIFEKGKHTNVSISFKNKILRAIILLFIYFFSKTCIVFLLLSLQNIVKQIKHMTNIKIDISKTLDFISQKDIDTIANEAIGKLETLYSKSGKGNDFLGWVNLPSEITTEFLQELMNDAAEIKKKAEVYVVVGIGGSYLGARAVIDALNHNFNHLLPSSDKNAPAIVYAGNNIGEDYMNDLLELLDKKDYCMAVISKSGTTTEPAVAFRILKQHIEKKYGKAEACKRIIAVTDKSRGALKQVSNTEGYKTYVIPDDIGGRFSVLTPVGLLPIAVAGFDIVALVNGAKAMQQFVESQKNNASNPVYTYVAARNALLRSGKGIEVLVNYLPSLVYMSEWWKQLYGESEGKDQKGIFTASVNFTTDLHSLGQYIQDGQRFLFETVLSVEKAKATVKVPNDPEDLDGLNFLNDKRLQEVNFNAELGTLLAHVDGGVPNIRISVPKIDESILGELIYFFEIACGVSGYILDVNPFDQPGVEAYKKNMFALLGKPGYEAQNIELKKRLGI